MMMWEEWEDNPTRRIKYDLQQFVDFIEEERERDITYNSRVSHGGGWARHRFWLAEEYVKINMKCNSRVSILRKAPWWLAAEIPFYCCVAAAAVGNN